MSCIATCADARGVVFVEKLIVYLPLMLTFFVTWELAELTSAQLVVQRAGSVAGRAAVVVLADDPSFYEGESVGSFSGRRREDIELAAGMILSSNPHLMSDFEVEVSDPPKDAGPIEVSISASYHCGGISLVCGTDQSIELTAVSTHTYQSARYEYTSPSEVAGSSAALSAYRAADRNGSDQASEVLDAQASYRAGPRPARPPGNRSDGDGSDWKTRNCEQCRTVYSGRCVKPSTAFSEGLWSKAHNAGTPLDLDIVRHVGVSSTTGFISATTDPEVAATFANACMPGMAYLYEMRVCGGIEIDYDKIAGEAACKPKGQGYNSPAYFQSEEIRHEQEVSVIDGFEGGDITRAIEVSKWDGEADPLEVTAGCCGRGKPVFPTTKNKAAETGDKDRIARCKASVARGEVAH